MSLGGCHCDPYCFCFNDCCIDYLIECETNLVDDAFNEATEGIDPSQFSCVQPAGNPRYNDKYWMVSQCDVRWSNEEMKAKCEGQAVNEDKLTSIPVQYLKSITFKNVYCAICSDKNISGITPWKIDLTCISKEYTNSSRSEFSAQEIGDIMKDCPGWYFQKPVSTTAARRCRHSAIVSCDVDPKNDTSILLAQACESYKAVLGIFKNPHCFMCHEASVYNQTMEAIYSNLVSGTCPPNLNRFDDEIIISKPIRKSISVKFDFLSGQGLPQKRPPVSILGSDGQTFDQLNKDSILTCPVEYDLTNDTCQRRSMNSECSLHDTMPLLIKVRCNHMVDRSNCNPDTLFKDYVMSLISGNYISSVNLSVIRFQAEIQGNDSFTVCTQTLDIWGYLRINVDVSEENLDGVFFSTSPQHSARNVICSNMSFMISVGCSSLNESCPNRIVSEDKVIKSYQNTTRQVFVVGKTKYSLVESLYVIEYDIKSSEMNLKRESLQGCEVPSETCALVSKNVSLFVDFGYGSYLYSPLNRTLAPNDYLDVGNDTILVCSYVLQSVQSVAGFLRTPSALYIIRYIGTSLSIISLILTYFVTYLKFNLLRKATSSTLVMSLCITLTFAQSVLLFNSLAEINSNVCL